VRPVAVVTGARRGIGYACAEALAQAGFDLAVTDLEEDRAVAAGLEALGASVLFLRSDLARIEEHAATAEAIRARFGLVHCLVNNAGISAPARGDLLDLSAENFDRVMAVNLRGTVFWTQALVPLLLAAPADRPRTIINVTSVSAVMSSPDRLDYCMSKAALSAFSQGLALRLAPEGITVFELRPGIIRTDMTAKVAERYDGAIAAGLVPAGRWGEPGDIGRIAASLAGGAFAFATGSVIHADGALSIPRL
jgi:NAD(P)-dependent dehydrogenase (short-subunit alcohol dehydrogenase family)